MKANQCHPCAARSLGQRGAKRGCIGGRLGGEGVPRGRRPLGEVAPWRSARAWCLVRGCAYLPLPNLTSAATAGRRRQRRRWRRQHRMQSSEIGRVVAASRVALPAAAGLLPPPPWEAPVVALCIGGSFPRFNLSSDSFRFPVDRLSYLSELFNPGFARAIEPGLWSLLIWSLSGVTDLYNSMHDCRPQSKNYAL